jgi:hypothetical protein
MTLAKSDNVDAERHILVMQQRTKCLSHRKGFSGSTWGDGDVQHDIRLAYERAGNAILAVAPQVLIVAEGVQNPHNNFASLPGIKAPWGVLLHLCSCRIGRVQAPS